MRKVITNFQNLSQAELQDFLAHMLQKMTGNANFPTPTVPLTDIATQRDDWLKQLSLSKSGSHEATTKATLLENELVSKLRKNGNYINDTADGDEAKLESSGYPLVKIPTYSPKPDIKFTQGQLSGECIVVIEAIPGALVYLCEIASDPCPSPDSKDWDRQKLSSKATITIKNLEPRKLYWFRFCYVTVEGEMDYSAPVSFSVN